MTPKEEGLQYLADHPGVAAIIADPQRIASPAELHAMRHAVRDCPDLRYVPEVARWVCGPNGDFVLSREYDERKAEFTCPNCLSFGRSAG